MGNFFWRVWGKLLGSRSSRFLGITLGRYWKSRSRKCWEISVCRDTGGSGMGMLWFTYEVNEQDWIKIPLAFI